MKEYNEKRLMKVQHAMANSKNLMIGGTVSFVFLFWISLGVVNTIYDVFQSFVKGVLEISQVMTFQQMVRFHSDMWMIYMALFFFWMVVVFKGMYEFKVSYQDYNVGQKGSERWTTIEELKEQYKEIDIKGTLYAGGGGVPIARDKDKLYIDDSPVNNLIIGMTRSGKGETFVFSTIDSYSRAEKKSTMIIADPKLELYRASKKTLEERGYDCYVFNLSEPLKSMGFNPLEEIVRMYEIGDMATAEMLTKSFAYSIFMGKVSEGDEFWANTSIALLSAMILAHVEDCLAIGKRECINMYSVYVTMSTLTAIKVGQNTTALDMYFSSRPPTNRARLKFAVVQMAGDKTKGSVYVNTLAKLETFSLENIGKMTAESTIQLGDIGFGEKPMAIFLSSPDYDSSNHFLMSVFVRQVYFCLAQRCTVGNESKCRNEVVFLLDEFGNMKAIEGLANILTVCLGRNIRFNLIVQSYAQIEELYGEHNSKTIIGNCGNQIYLLSSDDTTQENFSKIIGSETVTDISRNGKNLQTGKNFTESYIERPLITSNELSRLLEGQTLVKRVMKRRNNQGKKITPYPIFNRDEDNMFLFRYEYLLEYFFEPPVKPWMGDRSHIELEKIVFDFQPFFEKITEEEDKGKDGEFLVEEVNDVPICDVELTEEDIVGNIVETVGKEVNRSYVTRLLTFLEFCEDWDRMSDQELVQYIEIEYDRENIDDKEYGELMKKLYKEEG